MTPHEMVDRWYMALTMWAEARGTGPDGMRLVGWVIRNRRDDPRRRWPRTIPGVVTQSAVGARGRAIYQFSAWSPDDPNRAKMVHPLGQGPADAQAFLVALELADQILRAYPDTNPLPGVYWYHDRTIEPPAWTRDMVAVDAHPAFRFYREA